MIFHTHPFQNVCVSRDILLRSEACRPEASKVRRDVITNSHRVISTIDKKQTNKDVHPLNMESYCDSWAGPGKYGGGGQGPRIKAGP